MDFTENEQRLLANDGRKFAEEEIRPISVERDADSPIRARRSLGRILQKRVEAWFRTHGGAKRNGRPGKTSSPSSWSWPNWQGRQRHIQNLQPMLEVETT